MIPLSISQIVQLAVQSLTRPRVVMRQVLTFDVTRKQLFQLTLLLVVVDLMSGLLMEMLIPNLVAGGMGLSNGILPFFLLQMITILGGTVLIYYGGRAFGGTGDFDDSFKMVLWLNFVFFLLHFALPISALIAPKLQSLIFLGIVIASFIQMTAFVMVVHGFTKVVPVVFGILAAQLAFGIFLIIVLGVLGINLGLESG